MIGINSIHLLRNKFLWQNNWYIFISWIISFRLTYYKIYIRFINRKKIGQNIQKTLHVITASDPAQQTQFARMDFLWSSVEEKENDEQQFLARNSGRSQWAFKTRINLLIDEEHVCFSNYSSSLSFIWLQHSKITIKSCS